MAEKTETIPETWWDLGEDGNPTGPTDAKLMQFSKEVLVAELQKVKREQVVRELRLSFDQSTNRDLRTRLVAWQEMHRQLASMLLATCVRGCDDKKCHNG